MIPETKICTKCKVEKSQSEFRIKRRKYKLNIYISLNSNCKKCESICAKDYKLKNPEKVKMSQSNWRKDNQKYSTEYGRNNPEKSKVWTKNYRERNPEKVKIAQQNWRINNPEKSNESSRNWRINNPEKAKTSEINYKKSNPDKVLEYNKKMATDLHDSYVISNIKSQCNLSRTEIKQYPELIELTRTSIKIKRILKDGKSNELQETF